MATVVPPSGPSPIGSLLLGIAQGLSQGAINQHFTRQSQQDEATRAIAMEMAKSGQLHLQSPDILKAYEKKYGKEGFAALSTYSRSKAAENRAREAEQAVPNQLRQDIAAKINAPVTETQQLPAAAPPENAPPLPGLQPQPETETTQRPPTPAERLTAFNRLSATETALVTRDPELGKLRSDDIKATLKAQQEQRLREEFAGKVDRNVFEAISKKAVDLAAEGRHVTFEKMNDYQVPFEIPTTEGPKTIWVDSTGPELGQNLKDHLSRSFADIRDAGPADIDKALKEMHAEEAELAGESARVTAQEKYAVDRKLPLYVVDQSGFGNYWNVESGEQINNAQPFGDVVDATNTEGSGIKKLSENDSKAVKSALDAVPLLNKFSTLLKKVYGPGGAFEHVTPGLRTKEALEGAFARFLQIDTDLVVAQRTLAGLVERVGRTFTGAVGVQTEGDIKRFKNLLAKLTGRPDTKEVVFRQMNELYDFVEDVVGQRFGNPNFTIANRPTFGEDENAVTTVDGIPLGKRRLTR